jgi:hypothetical protein
MFLIYNALDETKVVPNVTHTFTCTLRNILTPADNILSFDSNFNKLSHNKEVLN